MDKIEDCGFEPFTYDADVCNLCGGLRAQHTRAAAHNANRALWQVLLDRGGIHDVHSGTNTARMPRLREHLAGCGIDWATTEGPRQGTVSRFVDTDWSDTQEKVVGVLNCLCRHYRFEQITIDDMTFGQLLWHALRLTPEGQEP